MRESPLPKLSAPAMRALKTAGFTSLEHLARVREQEVMALHGMGPKAMRVLKEAMASCGLAFKDA